MGGAKLKIDLGAVLHNYNYYKSILDPETLLMIVSKASSYGNGELEVVQLLEREKVDYIAVALCSEGVFFRNNDIQSKIMVFLTEEQDFEDIIKYSLEPSIYSLELLKAFNVFLENKNISHYPIHLKIDTGMNRLGIKVDDAQELIDILNGRQFHLVSVFSHLIASEDSRKDKLTNSQLDIFMSIRDAFASSFDHKILFHILNTRGISRFRGHHIDMVRLGIGLYGYSGLEEDDLKSINILETQILQIKNVRKGEFVGYGGDNVQDKDIKIATISIGYADGLSRHMGNGKAYAMLNGNKCPYVGNICMDISMIDVTSITCEVGDRVEIFGDKIDIVEIADLMNTIPYEVFTSISKRVKRVFIS